MMMFNQVRHHVDDLVFFEIHGEGIRNDKVESVVYFDDGRPKYYIIKHGRNRYAIPHGKCFSNYVDCYNYS